MLTFHDNGTITGPMEDFPTWMVVQGFSKAVRRLADSHDVKEVMRLADAIEHYSRHLKERYDNI